MLPLSVITPLAPGWRGVVKTRWINLPRRVGVIVVGVGVAELKLSVPGR